MKEKRKAAASGGITLKSFIRKVKKLVSDDPKSVDVSTVSCGPFMLYANFLHADDKELLKKPVRDLIADAITDSEAFETEFSRDDDNMAENAVALDGESFDLTVVVEDTESGEEVELPVVRIQRRPMQNQ